jgi:hypothetical protein
MINYPNLSLKEMETIEKITFLQLKKLSLNKKKEEVRIKGIN